MKKALTAVMVAVMFVLAGFSAVAFADGSKPEISNLVYQGERTLPRDGSLLKLTFVSNQKPDEIFAELYGGANKKGGMRGVTLPFSSKNKEIDFEIKSIELGKYEISASFNTGRPPIPGEYEVTVWMKSDGKKSNTIPDFENKVKITFPVQ